MSLFDNPEYRWRETYLLFLNNSRRPSAADVQEAIDDLHQNYELQDLKSDEEGRFESVTVIAADAFAAIDVSFATEEQIDEQIHEIQTAMRDVLEDPEELAKLDRITNYDARLDLLHFERLADVMAEDDEFSAFFDPGALLSVIDKLTEICDGVCLDPASSTIM